MLDAGVTQKHVDVYLEKQPRNYQSRRRLLFGVGNNDLPHIVSQKDVVGKLRTYSAYKIWSSMLQRSYSVHTKTRQPTYKNVTVADEWLTCSNFLKWHKEQVELGKFKYGWQLDKDLITLGNQVYSPESCLYVPSWINCFTHRPKIQQSLHLTGVTFRPATGKYRATCRNPKTLVQEYLGYFDTEKDAHLEWFSRKIALLRELKGEIDSVDLRLYDNIEKVMMEDQTEDRLNPKICRCCQQEIQK